MKKILTSALASLLLSISSGNAYSLVDLPKYQTPIPQSNIRIWHITQNLGPTGARGWFYIDKRTTKASREILIKSVEPKSPADGKLQQYDLILGSYILPDTAPHTWKGKPKIAKFTADARFALARAIAWAETPQGEGKLKLLCQRDGKDYNVIVNIPVLGAYQGLHPLECEKSKAISRNAADFLADVMPAKGYPKGAGMAFNPLFMLAHDDPKYMDYVRRSALRIAGNDGEPFNLKSSWVVGPTALFLCEYYLATGDERVLPAIETYSNAIAAGQCAPGTWAHVLVSGFRPPGYGSLNAAGVVCFTSLILAEQCGIEGLSEAIQNSINFYGSYAGKGDIPYGDHPPGSDPTSNGKNGMAAVAFNLLEADRLSQWFARMAASGGSYNFESGHSGNFFNQTWTPLAVNLTGKENYTTFWNQHNIYRDLARRHDGSFMTQPQPHGREGDLGSINYVPRGPLWSTGAFALSYLAGNNQLGITGRKRSVFAVDAPSIFASALTDYRNKDFKASAQKAQKLMESSDILEKQLAEQLYNISKKNALSAQLTLKDMESNLEVGDLYKVKVQLNAITSVVPDTDRRLINFKKALEGSDASEELEIGGRYYAHSKTIAFYGEKGYRHITYPGTVTHWKVRKAYEAAMEKKGSSYSKIASAHIESIPPILSEAKHHLIKENDKSKDWKILPENSKPPRGWSAVNFRDSDWKQTSTPLKQFKGIRVLRRTFEVEDPKKIERLVLEQNTPGMMKVYLNGELILHLDPEGGSSRYSKRSIPLKMNTKELLKRGENVIAVAVDQSKSRKPYAFDLGLKAALQKE